METFTNKDVSQPAEPNASESIAIIAQTLEHICARPGMFTLHGNYDEVAAWLLGWECGLERAGSRIATEWAEFQRWLPRRLNYPRNHSWIPYVKAAAPDDDKRALGFLLHLFNQYVTEKNASVNAPPQD